MKWIFRIGLAALLLLVVAIAGLFATGDGLAVRFLVAALIGTPTGDFDPAEAAAAPDYSDAVNWAALPEHTDLADRAPAGVRVGFEPGEAPVDVFFIHPTGFINGGSWTWSMDPNSASEENTRWMLVNQASVFNGCCNVYAPRYRQASIYAYFQPDTVLDEILDFAYGDVERAFDYFLEHFNDGRPFILASHSQGTDHSIRLLEQRLEGAPEAKRMVAAYLIGGELPRTRFEALSGITLCDRPAALRCAVHWDTYSEALIDEGIERLEGNVCTNPLSWRLAGGRVEADAHRGAVPISGTFQLPMLGDDGPSGMMFPALEAPIPQAVAAECRAGVLYVTDQTGSALEAQASLGDGNYHGLDYPLFHMDIRENAQLRVEAYLQANSLSPLTDATPPDRSLTARSNRWTR